MIYHRAGIWTQQEINDFEDCVDMQRFEKKGNRIFVKYPRKETSMTDKEVMKEGYYCVICGRFLPADEHGVIVHDDIEHPQEIDFGDEEKPQ